MSNKEGVCSEKIGKFLKKRNFPEALDFLKKHKKNLPQGIFNILTQHCFKECLNAGSFTFASDFNEIIKSSNAKKHKENLLFFLKKKRG